MSQCIVPNLNKITMKINTLDTYEIDNIQFQILIIIKFDTDLKMCKFTKI